MGRNAYDSIRNEIAATYSQELERISTERRLMNIQSFAALDCRGLGFVSRERRVLLHSTSFGERIFVQYPGKESERRGPDERPWDFRPKLVMRNGIVAADLPFIAVWTDLQDVASRDRDSLPVIATLLFRMAKRQTSLQRWGIPVRASSEPRPFDVGEGTGRSHPVLPLCSTDTYGQTPAEPAGTHRWRLCRGVSLS